MSRLPRLTRRSFLAFLAAQSGLVAPMGWGGPRDQGIGGTGATLAPQTGGALKIGQVVHVVATDTASRLSTRQINITSEVVGRVEKASARTLTILGQNVLLGRLPKELAVSGLRRPDGAIVASLIERRSSGLQQVAGPVDVAPDGSPVIGRLKLAGIDAALIGQRAILRGRLADGAFRVVKGQSAQALLGAGLARLSIEAYVERGPNGLRFGSGLPVAGGADAQVPLNRSVLAVIDANVDRRGGWQVTSVRHDPGRDLGRDGGRGGGSDRSGPSGGAGENRGKGPHGFGSDVPGGHGPGGNGRDSGGPSGPGDGTPGGGSGAGAPGSGPGFGFDGPRSGGAPNFGGTSGPGGIWGAEGTRRDRRT